MSEKAIVKSNFIGSFKLGDNITHNLEILGVLYVQFNSSDTKTKNLLCKPITIIIASIAEALLYDFHLKANGYVNEGIKGISETILTYIRSKKIDEFEKYIVSARKHEILGSATDPIYEELEELRKLRNRVHIQNTRGHFEPGESKAFNQVRMRKAEKVLEKVMRVMEIKYDRGHSYVGDFILPWNAHLSHKVGNAE